MLPCLFGLFWHFLDQMIKKERRKNERTFVSTFRVVFFAATINGQEAVA